MNRIKEKPCSLMTTNEFWKLNEVSKRLVKKHTLKNFILWLKYYTLCLKMLKNYPKPPVTWDSQFTPDFAKAEYTERQMYLLFNEYWPEGEGPDYDGMLRSLSR